MKIQISLLSQTGLNIINISHMTSFKDDDKTKFNESFINLAFKNGLKRNENFKIPYMNKYHYHHDLKNNEIKSI